MNIWMTYIKQIYTAFIRVSVSSVTAIVPFSFGASPLRKIEELQSPRAHSFNQNLL